MVGRRERCQDKRGRFDQICDLWSNHFAKSQALDFVMMNTRQKDVLFIEEGISVQI